MQHTVVVAVSHTSEKLKQKRHDHCGVQSRLAHIEIFFQILVQVLKYERQFALRVHDVVQSDNVGMPQLLEKRNLSNCC